MLDKLTVPGAANFAALLPIQHKFRNRIFHKGEADIGVFNQYFQRVFTGAPLAVHGDFLIAAEKVSVVALLITALLAR